MDNFATLGAVSSVTITVPAGKRWILYGGYIERDQNATLTYEIRNAADKNIFGGGTIAAGTSNVLWGLTAILLGSTTFLDYFHFPYPLIMEAGSDILISWGAAQTTPEITALVLEVPAE